MNQLKKKKIFLLETKIHKQYKIIPLESKHNKIKYFNIEGFFKILFIFEIEHKSNDFCCLQISFLNGLILRIFSMVKWYLTFIESTFTFLIFISFPFS